MIRRHNRSRSGFTLVEMLVSITIITSMLTLVGVTFHLLLRSEKSVSNSFVIERSIASLSNQFRDDVHRAESGVISQGLSNAPQPELNLAYADGTRIRYQVSSRGVKSLRFRGDTVDSEEDFLLPECRINFSSGDEPDSTLLTLLIERPGAILMRKQNAQIPLWPLRIEASIHRRHAIPVAAIPSSAAAVPVDDASEISK